MAKKRRQDHPLYTKYNRMYAACYKEWSPEYLRIGARGITLYWERSEFWDFVDYIDAKLGPAPWPHAHLARINQAGNFEPGNLCWSTAKEVGNRQLKNTYVKFKKRTQTLKAWSEEYGVNYHTFRDRLNRGWDFETALTTGVWELTHR